MCVFVQIFFFYHLVWWCSKRDPRLAATPGTLLEMQVSAPSSETLGLEPSSHLNRPSG